MYAKRQFAIVLPIARENKQDARMRSRAVAASADDQVKTVITMNQDASSGKCVWIECGSRAPAATKAYRIPIAVQKLPQIVLIIVTGVSRAWNPFNPAIN